LFSDIKGRTMSEGVCEQGDEIIQTEEGGSDERVETPA
jgi:hypothetical protein